jgi:hypothetical protein
VISRTLEDTTQELAAELDELHAFFSRISVLHAMRVSHTTQRRLLLRVWAARPLRAPLTRRSLVTATEAATQRRAFGVLTQPLAPSHKNGTPIL